MMNKSYKWRTLAALFATVYAANHAVSAEPTKNGGSLRSPCSALQSKLLWPTYRRGDDVEYTDPADIKAIQYLLRAHGFWPRKGSIDGVFGTQTERAVKNFQRTRHLKADGIVGPRTMAVLVIPVKRGSRGDAVRAVQTLFTKYYLPGLGDSKLTFSVDGIFGFLTETGVRQFQRPEENTKVDGIVGPVTWHLLFTVVYNGN